MAKIKLSNNILEIFIEGLKMYFKNFDKFARYMLFPVFGQIVGVIISLVCAFFYIKNIEFLLDRFEVLNNFWILLGVSTLVVLPGMLLFMKAFWEYLVAYGAISSMCENAIKSGHVYDFGAHTQRVTQRSGAYIGLWLLVGLYWFIGINPLFWIIAGVFEVYFVLIFQVFIFEPELSPVGCFKRSFQLIKGNFLKTLGLMVWVGALTYWILPEITKSLFEVINIIGSLAVLIEAWVQQFPIDEINNMLPALHLTALWVATAIVANVFAYAVTSFTLPIRSICWSLWYKKLAEKNDKNNKKSKCKSQS